MTIDRSTPPMKDLYQQVILDHYRNPRNRGELPAKTVEIHMRNPTCGDEIKLQLQVEGDRIADVKFLGEGCSISQASVSMMTGLLKDKPLDEAMQLASRFTAMMHGDEEAARDSQLGNLRALQGVSRFPVRIKCALLGFDALQEAVKKTRSDGNEAGEPAAKPEANGQNGQNGQGSQGDKDGQSGQRGQEGERG